jgi:hypothetical protein
MQLFASFFFVYQLNKDKTLQGAPAPQGTCQLPAATRH